MSEQQRASRRPDRDGGFTLVEILIVVGLIGILSATLAAVVTVMVRTMPDADERVTDARTLKGLVTWLPQDMDATPTDGFSDDASSWSCSGPAPSDSYNILAMTWDESSVTSTTFHASYRYELVVDEWRVARYSCENGGVPSRVNVTSELSAWDASSPPASVDMCSTALDPITGNCPAGNEVADPAVDPVESLKMTLTLLDGSLYTVDAAAKNPDEDLKDDPDAVTNLPPTSASSGHAVSMLAGDSVVLDLYAAPFFISDPESDVLTSARDSFSPLPPGITVTSSDPLLVTIDADASMSAGPLPDAVVLIVSDAYGGSVVVTVSIEILAPPNDPPVATISPSYSTPIDQGETLVLPLDVTHGIVDPNDDAMTVDVLSWPAPLASKPDVGPPLGDLQVALTAKAGAAVGPVVDPVLLRITDEHGAATDVTVFLEITTPTANTPPTVTIADVPVSMEPGAGVTMSVDVSHGAADPDLDVIWVAVDPAVALPPGLTVTTSGLGLTIEADPLMGAGPAGAVSLLVHDAPGAAVPITVTVEIIPPPPPPTDCVLGGLSIDESPVGRASAGNGPSALDDDVLVTLNYSGSCDGLVLKYDTGHPSGLGSGVGRVFPVGSPATVVLVGYDSGGTEKWDAGDHVLTASTTSAVSPDSVSITLTVN